jgi:hypothetical protein
VAVEPLICPSGKSACVLARSCGRGAEYPLRVEYDLFKPFKMIWVVQSPLVKIFRFPSTQIDGSFRAVSFQQEGRIARRHERGTGCGGRESVGAIAVAGRARLVSDHAACRTNDVSRVRQNRVVPTPVAGAKLADVFPSPTGFGQTLICKRR